MCNYVPGILTQFDMGDIAGLIAPRPLVIVNGAKDDGIFPLNSALEQARNRRGWNAVRHWRARTSSVPARYRPGGPPVLRARRHGRLFDEVTGWNG